MSSSAVGRATALPRKIRTGIWKENINWSWRFKNKDIWLNIDFKDSKFFKSGEMHYLTDKGLYQMTLVDKADKKLVFEGGLKKNKVTVTADRSGEEGRSSGGHEYHWRRAVHLELQRQACQPNAFTKEYQIA